MFEYVEHIILPYIRQIRDKIGSDKPALVIIDNCKGKITDSIHNLLEFS